MKETDTGESLLAHSCLGYWCGALWLSAYDHKREVKRVPDADLSPDTFSKDMGGWAKWTKTFEEVSA